MLTNFTCTEQEMVIQAKNSKRVRQRSTETGADLETGLNAAVVTVLPRLLKHSIGYRRWWKNTQDLIRYQSAMRLSYAEEYRVFCRWLGSLFRKKEENRKLSAIPVNVSQMNMFFCLLENKFIQRFLFTLDPCKVYADAYLLAMVFTYFLRAEFTMDEYTPLNFFVALCLAHDIEEEGKYYVDHLVVSVELDMLEMCNECNFKSIDKLRFELFMRMKFRALVSRKCCEEVMSMFPEHWAWTRKRAEHHSGVDQESRYPLNSTDQPQLNRYTQIIPWDNRFVGCPFHQCKQCITMEQHDAEEEKRRKLAKNGKSNRLARVKRPVNSTSQVFDNRPEDKRFLTLTTMENVVPPKSFKVGHMSTEKKCRTVLIKSESVPYAVEEEETY